MTEQEICRSYRQADNKKYQLQVLMELTCKSKYQIIAVLFKNGENIPQSMIDQQLYRRLDKIEEEVADRERECKEIANALIGENRRKEHGNRIQRHGRTEKEQQGRS